MNAAANPVRGVDIAWARSCESAQADFVAEGHSGAVLTASRQRLVFHVPILRRTAANASYAPCDRLPFMLRC